MESLEPDWEERRRAHERRVDALIGDHLARRRSGIKHPVLDFLFTYYSFRPAQLRRWHPGLGESGGEPVKVRRDSVRWIHDLLVATANRPGHFGCFGMHEWAMVYRQSQQELRHNAWPLRLSPERTAAVVEERGVHCSHFDAFRFFTPAARPLNVLTPTRESQIELDQPGCLHANMDLYKWSYKLYTVAPSELIADCFELALDIRALDMRASPYDLADLGYAPVRIETPEGRAEYAAAQRANARRAAPLRQRLIEICATALRDI
ncbi:3-methyladenine DNA glycosylase [Allorhizocola rhizosphaerae]|uniref:3-methyladenine DNA glycosylase n=1 Tax=Allorhizocola rhizosphaerae TaxID=1872709 RepID=UPI000E3BCBA6|nr:3-methyladenine DNA glycosylase [Allorhizocola rhizosphaerae]